MERIEQAAEQLLEARRAPDRRMLDLPEPIRPRDAGEAYAIQRAVQARLGAIGGWKVGAAGDSFTCAPLAATGILTSPADIRDSDRFIEAEIAVRLAADLPPQDVPYTAADLLAAIQSAHPAIEVLESRFAGPAAPSPLSALADNLSHHSLVLGPAIDDWRAIDLAQEPVAIRIDGREIKRAVANPAGDMLRLLVWLASHGAHWAGGLRAGQVVTTGSWTGKDLVPPGSAATIRFAHAGEASVRFVER